MSESTYEVVLGPGAKAVIVRLASAAIIDALAEALRTELPTSPNPRFVRKFGDVETDQIVLSMGYTAVVQQLTAKELQRLSREKARAVHPTGWYVYDLLSPGDGINAPART